MIWNEIVLNLIDDYDLWKIRQDYHGRFALGSLALIILSLTALTALGVLIFHLIDKSFKPE